MRKSIFQIIEENDNLERKIGRIVQLFQNELIVVLQSKNVTESYSMKTVIDEGLFKTWKQRRYCVNLDEYLEILEYEDLCLNSDMESFIVITELVYNFWMLIYTNIYCGEQPQYKQVECTEFLRVKMMLDEYLSQCNHRAVHYPEEEKVLVVPDNEAVTAVVEIVDAPLAMEILQYNHHSLKGNLNAKKSILRNLGDALELRRKELHKVDSTLETTIFHILNSMGIRHMNAKNEANVVKVGNDLEYWFDELYQMMLLAFLRMDNVKRMNKYEEELKSKLT